MKLSIAAACLAGLLPVLAHPEKMTAEKAKRSASLIGRATGNCAAQIEARKESMIAKRSQRLLERRIAAGNLSPSAYGKRNELKYTTIQNDTCVLAPDTIFGPYAVDNEMIRHDLRELSSGQVGLDLYLDIGVIDVETCEPLPQAALTIWSCNATGYYSGFTGIDPDTAELFDGWTKMNNGMTDEETFLRGIQITDDEGMAEFLTLFPGYYTSRTTHVHVTVQTDVVNGTSYSASSVQHIGQLFFEDSILDTVYATSPYSAHLETLDPISNANDKIYSTASADGFSAVISIEQITSTLSDGLVGYITIGVNSSAEGLETTGQNVNVLGVIPTLSLNSTAYAAATAVDRADGYTS